MNTYGFRLTSQFFTGWHNA